MFGDYKLTGGVARASSCAAPIYLKVHSTSSCTLSFVYKSKKGEGGLQKEHVHVARPLFDVCNLLESLLGGGAHFLRISFWYPSVNPWASSRYSFHVESFILCYPPLGLEFHGTPNCLLSVPQFGFFCSLRISV